MQTLYIFKKPNNKVLQIKLRYEMAFAGWTYPRHKSATEKMIHSNNGASKI